jgi:hypothetical protein
MRGFGSLIALPFEKRKATESLEPDLDYLENTMQISRHWRMNAQRYRLQGLRSVPASAPQTRRGEQELALMTSNTERPAQRSASAAR